MNFSINMILALKAIFDASIVVLKTYKSGNYNINVKKDNSPVTEADKESNKIIYNILEKSNFPVLSEESKEIKYSDRKNWNKFWMIDPIDGTKEFINRNGEFTINIALIEENKPILGVVFAPVLGTLYIAEKNFGTYMFTNVRSINDLKKGNIKNLSESTSPKIYTLVISKSHIDAETEKFVMKKKKEYETVEIINMGSSLKICKVAEGIASCYPRFGKTMEWDTAAAHAVVKFAGGNIYDKETHKEISYNKQNLFNPFFIVLRS